MSLLFSPLKLRGLALANRIIVSPMCQYSADMGKATAWHTVHLGTLSHSGAALLFIEATGVEPKGRISPKCLGLWDDATEAALARVLSEVRAFSDLPIGMQLAHAGRKASVNVPWENNGTQIPPTAPGGWQTLAPSAVPFNPGDAPPLALDATGLRRIREAFANAARRAARLGLAAVEVHAAHGYLLHQFLSPLSNRRTDEYGGALENRMRFPLEVFEAVRAAFPADKPVGVRVSATDWVEGGWDPAQTVVFAEALKKRGVDWIDASSGGLSPQQKITLGPGYQVPFAERIKREVDVTTVAVGLVTEPEQAEQILLSGQADLIALARGMLYDPRWGWHAAARLGASVKAPPQYWRSQPHSLKSLFTTDLPAPR